MTSILQAALTPAELPFLNELAACENLPSPPGIADRILSMAEDYGATAEDFAEVIRVDVALAGRLLQLANSPIYKQRREVDDISRAVTLLGLEATLTNALSIALVSSIQKHGSSGLDKTLFWRRSIASACGAQLLGKHLRCDAPETFFMAGLLHDIGMVALDSFDPGMYSGIKQYDHAIVAEHERKSIGMDHAAAGAWLLSNWGLPTKYCQAVLASHKPQEIIVDPQNRQLAECVAVASHIADIFFSADQPGSIQRTLRQGAALTSLTAEVLENILERMVVELTSLAGLFDMDLGTPDSLQAACESAIETINAERQAAGATA